MPTFLRIRGFESIGQDKLENLCEGRTLDAGQPVDCRLAADDGSKVGV
jgi:hypothetical protein